MNLEEPPTEQKLFTTYLILILIIGLLIGYFIGRETRYNIHYNEQSIVLEAPNTPVFIKNQALASVMEEFDLELYNLAYKIIECESGWDYTAQNPTSTAYGLGQVIDGTFLWVQKKWGIELDRDNPEDQMYIIVRLLEEKGYSHWAESAHCWDKEHKYVK